MIILLFHVGYAHCVWTGAGAVPTVCGMTTMPRVARSRLAHRDRRTNDYPRTAARATKICFIQFLPASGYFHPQAPFGLLPSFPLPRPAEVLPGIAWQVHVALFQRTESGLTWSLTRGPNYAATAVLGTTMLQAGRVEKGRTALPVMAQCALTYCQGSLG